MNPLSRATGVSGSTIAKNGGADDSSGDDGAGGGGDRAVGAVPPRPSPRPAPSLGANRERRSRAAGSGAGAGSGSDTLESRVDDSADWSSGDVDLTMNQSAANTAALFRGVAGHAHLNAEAEVLASVVPQKPAVRRGRPVPPVGGAGTDADIDDRPPRWLDRLPERYQVRSPTSYYSKDRLPFDPGLALSHFLYIAPPLATTLSFSEFKRAWAQHGLPMVHLLRGDEREKGDQDEVERLYLGRLYQHIMHHLVGHRPLVLRLYCLYALYALQTTQVNRQFVERVPVDVPVDKLRLLLAVASEAKQRGSAEAAQILRAMLRSPTHRAARVCADHPDEQLYTAGETCAYDRNPMPLDPGYVASEELGLGRVGTTLQSIDLHRLRVARSAYQSSLDALGDTTIAVPVGGGDGAGGVRRAADPGSDYLKDAARVRQEYEDGSRRLVELVKADRERRQAAARPLAAPAAPPRGRLRETTPLLTLFATHYRTYCSASVCGPVEPYTGEGAACHEPPLAGRRRGRAGAAPRSDGEDEDAANAEADLDSDDFVVQFSSSEGSSESDVAGANDVDDDDDGGGGGGESDGGGGRDADDEVAAARQKQVRADAPGHGGGRGSRGSRGSRGGRGGGGGRRGGWVADGDPKLLGGRGRGGSRVIRHDQEPPRPTAEEEPLRIRNSGPGGPRNVVGGHGRQKASVQPATEEGSGSASAVPRRPRGRPDQAREPRRRQGRKKANKEEADETEADSLMKEMEELLNMSRELSAGLFGSGSTVT